MISLHRNFTRHSRSMKILRTIVLVILYMAVLSVLLIWGRSYGSWQLRQQLQRISPLWLEINFSLILLALLLNAKRLKELALSLSKRTRILLPLIVSAGILLTMFVAPRTHRIYYDEDIYLNIGQNIADLDRAAMCNEGKYMYGDYQCHQLEYNKEPNGWPYLLSLLFRLMGSSPQAGFMLNNVLWGLSGLLVFCLAWLLFDSETVGLFGALLFVLLPEGLRWANTAAVEPSAAFFTGLALLSVLLFVRYPENGFLFLAAVLIPFGFQFRPESGMLVAPAVLLLLLWAPGELKKRRMYIAILLLLVLAIPHFIHLYAVRGEGWGASGGAKFSLQYLKNNFNTNFFFYVKNVRFPVLWTLFVLLSFAVPVCRQAGEQTLSKASRLTKFLLCEKLVLWIWFLLFWGIFLFFYAGSYNYGVDVRFSLVSYIPLSILAGLGAAGLNALCRERFSISWGASALLVFILMSFLSFMPFIREIGQEAWSSRADHRFAELMAQELPHDSLVLTHNPNMFLLWGKNAAQASVATYNPEHLKNLFVQYPGGLYFHYNFWCTVPDAVQNAFCENILERFDSTEILAFQEQNTTYRLYKIELK